MILAYTLWIPNSYARQIFFKSTCNPSCDTEPLLCRSSAKALGCGNSPLSADSEYRGCSTSRRDQVLSIIDLGLAKCRLLDTPSRAFSRRFATIE
jgi:hypothetical protein